MEKSAREAEGRDQPSFGGSSGRFEGLLVWDFSKNQACWASKCKPKIQPMSQPKSPEIGAASPKAILILAASLEVALLPMNVSEEVRQDGPLSACSKTDMLATQILPKVVLVPGVSVYCCVEDDAFMPLVVFMEGNE